jgi:hypothetical protein
MFDKLNLNLLDLLSILLPGGLLLVLALRMPWLQQTPLFQVNYEAWQMGAMFAAASYVLGHFVYMVASYLDDRVFEKVRRVYWNDHRLVAYVIQMKNEELGIADRKVFNAFKWSLAKLMKDEPAMYQAVERHIAESKFFRSFFVAAIWNGLASEALVAAALALLSLVRYMTQRVKAIDSAYHYVLASSGKRFDEDPDPAIMAELQQDHIDFSHLEGWKLRCVKFYYAVLLCFGWKPH